MKAENGCARCNKPMECSTHKKLCHRCGDIIDFGYPSFEPYPLVKVEANPTNRMEISEGWTLPSYVMKK